MNKDLKSIIDNYGILPQLKYFQSEVWELNEAIINYENFIEKYHNFSDPDIFYAERDSKAHIAEEIADCYVMLEQFRHYYGIKDNEIETIMNQKIKRQLARIEEEKGCE